MTFISSAPETTAQAEASNSFPLGALLALSLASFLATANETVPAGLLPQIAQGFDISHAWAGQLVTLCALGSGVAAIPLTSVTRTWRRRHVLLVVLSCFFVCNLITAVSENYLLTLGTRFLVGLATGLAWSVLASYARSLASPGLQGRAVAVAMLGIPLALALGVPLASWLGQRTDWQNIFVMLCALTVLLMLWVLWKVPDRPGQAAGRRLPIRQVIQKPGVRPVLFVVMAWILSHYILYTYIAPFLEAVGLLDRLSSMLLVFGMSSVLGVFGVGLLVDRYLRPLVLLGLAAFALVSLTFGLGAMSVGALYLGVAIWGLSFSGAPTLLQTAIADTAGDAADVAQSILVTVFNLAFACSGVIGGVLLETLGVASFPWVLLSLLLLGLWVALQAKNHGFKPGQRIVTPGPSADVAR